jgi:biopolymer transport protein ExbB
METSSAFGIAHLWQHGDPITRATALFLLSLSILTWSILALRGIVWWRERKSPGILARFCALGVSAGRQEEWARMPASIRAIWAVQTGPAGPQGTPEAAASQRRSRLLAFALRKVRRELEMGLTVLASIASTAPFIGLFGTVWAIYHALITIGSTGQTSLPAIAGPVGEALIMTAAGIAVAVPAALGYNLFLRFARRLGGDLAHFAAEIDGQNTPVAAAVAEQQ